MHRQVIIYSPKKLQIPKSTLKQLTTRHTKISHHITQRTTEPSIELYGYDKGLKYTAKITPHKTVNSTMQTIIQKIDEMPMGSIEALQRREQTRQKTLLAKCGLPDIPEIQHCFADSTHHTCCMLGDKAREYADASGNPIGALSVKVHSKISKGNAKAKANAKTKTHKGKLMPW